MNHLLLLHGAIGSASQFAPLRKKLENDYYVHAPDFPGHGGSPIPEKFSIPLFSQFTQDYCRQHKLQQVQIFGYSMGGFVGLHLARNEPGLVSSVITLATKFDWDPVIAEKEISMLQPDRIEAKLPSFATSLRERHAPENWKMVLEKTTHMLRDMGTDNTSSTPRWSEIEQPVLLVLSDRDKMVSQEETLAVYRQLKQGQYCVLPGTAHPIESVDTELLKYIIRRFPG
jgi:pimeloyl-ACP methyl ester carboxylesterase